MKIKKFEQINERLLDESEHEHHVDLIIQYLFDIQDNFTKLGDKPILLQALKNDLSNIIKRYDLK
jgi:hypothetical protein